MTASELKKIREQSGMSSNELAGKVKRCESVLKEVMHELALLDGKALKNIEEM